jgi:hypothetical protein
MPPHVRKVMLPGLGCLAVAVVIDSLLAWSGAWPDYVRVRHTILPANWVWLLSLPLCGAIGADLALRAGATVKGRMLAATLPAFTTVVVFAAMAAVEVPMQLTKGHTTGINTYDFAAILGFALWQVTLPGVLLVLGSLPFVIDTARAP